MDKTIFFSEVIKWFNDENATSFKRFSQIEIMFGKKVNQTNNLCRTIFGKKSYFYYSCSFSLNVKFDQKDVEKRIKRTHVSRLFVSCPYSTTI